MSGSAGSVGYTEQGRRVADHWSRLAITYEGALAALAKRGISSNTVRVEDLHSLDMMHMGGVAATDLLASAAKISAGQEVLDVGCGVGGPARRIASKYGAAVWGVELSETLYETAVKFTQLVDLSERVRFKRGSVLALPFADGAFDVVVMQHVAMQISEKEQLFHELARVINPGGRLAMHEIFSGEGALRYPLAWATEPSMSALEPFAACAVRLSRAGFTVGEFDDHSEDGRKVHEANIASYREALSRAEGTRGFSIEVVEARLRASEAMEFNLCNGSLKVGMVVATKAG
jgi:sarcosine/dimethylglycine N-methyltransferase